MMSRSRPWKTGGGPIAILRATTSTGEMRSLTSLVDERRLGGAEQGHDADAPTVELRVGQDGLDFVDDRLGLGSFTSPLRYPPLTNTSTSGGSRRSFALGTRSGRMSLSVELAVRELDDGRHAAEVLLQHDRVAGEHDAGQVVDRLVRRHLRAVRLVGQEPADQLLDFLFGSADRRRRHLLVVADDQHLLAAQQGGQRPDVGLRRLVNDDQVEQPDFRRNGLGHAPLRQHPAGHGLVRPTHRVARSLAVANGAHAGARAHRLHGVQVAPAAPDARSPASC